MSNNNQNQYDRLSLNSPNPILIRNEQENFNNELNNDDFDIDETDEISQTQGNRTIKKKKQNISSCFTFWSCSIVIAVISCLLGIGYLKLQLDQTNQKLMELMQKYEVLNNDYYSNQIFFNSQLLTLRNQTNSLQSTEESFRSTTTDLLTRVHSNVTNISHKNKMLEHEVINHDKLLTVLTNRTTNAEVLEQLQTTKHIVDSKLQESQVKVDNILQDAKYNVSVQLELAHSQMDSSLAVMANIVSDAKHEIYKIQSNVSDKLNIMAITLEETESNLNAVVKSAQDIINAEVSNVKQDIHQYVEATDKQFARENDFVKYQLAGTFTLLGCLICLYHMTQHLRNFYKPDVQRRVMAVIWMVPMYDITSWLSLVFPSIEMVLGAIRDFYEAYAVYTFIALLIAVIEDGKGLQGMIKLLIEQIVEERRQVAEYNPEIHKIKPVEHIRPPIPCGYVYHKPFTVATQWLWQCKLLVMQFVFFKPLLSSLPFIITVCGIDYHNETILLNGTLNSASDINWNAPKLYVTILQNLSVALAFYGLLSFYHGTEKDLAWIDPWPKFLCIKGVVFMTFWQNASLQVMSTFGFVDAKAATQIQNLLICLEMLLASIAHVYIFPDYEWQDGYKKIRSDVALKDTLAISDFYSDVRQMVTKWVDPEDIPASLRSNHGLNSDDNFPREDSLLVENDDGIKYTISPSARTSPRKDEEDDEDCHSDNSSSNLMFSKHIQGISSSMKRRNSSADDDFTNVRLEIDANVDEKRNSLFDPITWFSSAPKKLIESPESYQVIDNTAPTDDIELSLSIEKTTSENQANDENETKTEKYLDTK